MNLQSALDPLRLCLDRKALGTYMGMIRWLLVYIYVSDIILTCSTTFSQNLNSCTTQLYYL
jgi:hypothetical protein